MKRRLEKVEWDMKPHCPNGCYKWGECLYEEPPSSEAIYTMSLYRACCGPMGRTMWPLSGGPMDQLTRVVCEFTLIDEMIAREDCTTALVHGFVLKRCQEEGKDPNAFLEWLKEACKGRESATHKDYEKWLVHLSTSLLSDVRTFPESSNKSKPRILNSGSWQKDTAQPESRL